MKPSDLSLFSEKEQTLLVATEKRRMADMTEDELDDLLTLIRRARNKYSKLHRRQAATSIEAAGKRAAASSSNERTARKAEIFEDALSRVATALAAAARVSRDELKRERLDAARAAGAPTKGGGRTTSPAKPSGSARPLRSNPGRTGSGSGGKGHVSGNRAGSTRATNARSQARRDRPR